MANNRQVSAKKYQMHAIVNSMIFELLKVSYTLSVTDKCLDIVKIGYYDTESSLSTGHFFSNEKPVKNSSGECPW